MRWVVGLGRLLVVSSCLGGCLHAPPPGTRPMPETFLVVGHRGAPLQAPENTIASLKEAIRQGANAVEVDLCLTGDGQVVLWHDQEPDDLVAVARRARLEGLPWVPVVPGLTSPMRVPVYQLTLVQLQSAYGYARAGSDTIDASAPIATLDDLVAWAKTTPQLKALVLDIKVKRKELVEQLVKAMYTAVSDAASYDVFFLSTSSDTLTHLRNALDRTGRARFHPVLDAEENGALARAEALGIRRVALGKTITRINHAFLADVRECVEARDAGRLDLVLVWTIDGRKHLHTMLAWGTNGILTNEPGHLAQLVANPGPFRYRPQDYPWYAPWHRDLWFSGEEKE
jgi:glycerophosphoryl diester phosphodiesterase